MMANYVPDTRRVFLADGDALNLDSEYMIKILKYIREKFANIERISCYAMPMNILKKTPEELKKMNDAGLDMFYLGIESGSDIVLKKVTKGAVAKTIIKSVNKAKELVNANIGTSTEKIEGLIHKLPHQNRLLDMLNHDSEPFIPIS